MDSPGVGLDHEVQLVRPDLEPGGSSTRRRVTSTLQDSLPVVIVRDTAVTPSPEMCRAPTIEHVSQRRTLCLLDDAMLGVFDVRCLSPAGRPGSEEYADVTQVVLPVDGVFEVHHGRDSVTADAASVVVFGAGSEHRVGHPASGGDRSMVLIFPPGVVDGALDLEGRSGGPVGPRVYLGARSLGSALRRGAICELEAEESALLLLDLIGADLDRTRGYRPPGRHQRARVERVRALLASAPDRRWRLDELARIVHCSSFHLARQFRALTGSSIGTYLVRLRLALALQRLANGETDLAGLAGDLGFASHSHFSARFGSIFGLSPSSMRDRLTAGRLAELRTFVTAKDGAAS